MDNGTDVEGQKDYRTIAPSPLLPTNHSLSQPSREATTRSAVVPTSGSVTRLDRVVIDIDAGDPGASHAWQSELKGLTLPCKPQ